MNVVVVVVVVVVAASECMLACMLVTVVDCSFLYFPGAGPYFEAPLAL